MNTNPGADDDLPTTVEAAVRLLRYMVPELHQAEIASMPEEDLVMLQSGLGLWIRNSFGLWRDGSKLLAATGAQHPDDASLVIIRALWQNLRRERNRVH